ncbi:MAG: recombinase family protein [Bacteroidaceae bacterium]|nr:recombinase family protein [Bacteroidaceae bacterium]
MEHNVAIYCRVSTQMQSTDRQREELLTLASKKSWEISEDKIYVDIISGYKAGEVRPEFSRMLSELSPKGITCILFSEFSRLARNATELLEQVNFFRERKIDLYFEKQNIWVTHDNKDLAGTILLHVLAVMSSYEIELFAERSMSGKINKLQAGGGGGIEFAYGYKLNEAKKLVKVKDEAVIVERIFAEYANGKSSVQICDMLNAEGVPSPYKKRLGKKREERRRQGLNEKEYKRFDLDKIMWRPSSLNRLMHNEIYIGKKNVIFHKPDPTNPVPVDKRKDREVVYEYNEYDVNLRIISDELWYAVQERLLQASYNKNNAIKRENLLKTLLICGECGSNFSVSGSTVNSKYVTTINKYERKYACYGAKGTSYKKQTCSEGGQIAMTKLDGLVLQFSLKMFAETNIAETNEELIIKLNEEIDGLEVIRKAKEQELLQIDADYKKILKRTLLLDNDSLAEELIKEEQDKYQLSSGKLKTEISKLIKRISALRVNISNIRKLNVNTNLYAKMHDVRTDRGLIKTMVDEYIDKIFVYRIHKLWFLVVVKYKNGVELWGKIKNARYRNDELFYDEFCCRYGVEFQTWVIDNTNHSFCYDKERKIIVFSGGNDLYPDLEPGEYDYERMNQYMMDSQNMGSFPLYLYEDLSLKTQEGSHVIN